MNTTKKVIQYLGLILVSLNFSQCASTIKLQEKAPTTFGEVYCQSWVAGVKGGGAGTNIFIETKNPEIILDSVFFRGKVTKLVVKPANKKLVIGRFLSNSNTERPGLEVTDKVEVSEAIPFKLKENECVVSYTVNGETKYYRLKDIKEKPLEALPMSAPPNKN